MDHQRCLIPGQESYTEMDPTEFERFCMNLLKKEFGNEAKYSFSHNVIERSYDGKYQIDGEIIFLAGGLEFKILVECKRYKGPIERDVIEVLENRIKSIGAQKGIVITTSFFQSGALEYAKAHGIALVQVVDGKLNYQSRSEDGKIPSFIENMLPDHLGVLEVQTSKNSVQLSYLNSPGAIKYYLFSDVMIEEM